MVHQADRLLRRLGLQTELEHLGLVRSLGVLALGKDRDEQWNGRVPLLTVLHELKKIEGDQKARSQLIVPSPDEGGHAASCSLELL